MTNEEQKELERKALEQFMSGKSLFGRDGVFAPMLKSFIERKGDGDGRPFGRATAFQGKQAQGRGSKTIKSGVGTFDIETPQDRQSGFEPEPVRKRQTILADNLSEVTKTKGEFTNDMALLKLLYLATKKIEKKWTSPLHNWSLTVQQLYIKFGDRIPLLLNTNSLGASSKGIETTDRV